MQPRPLLDRFRHALPVLLLVPLVAVLLGGSLAAQGLPSNPLLLDMPRNPVEALDFQSETVLGAPVRLSDYRGQVVLLNFWATWCTPCLLEMPAMDRLNRKLAGKPFKMLAINAAETKAQVAKFAKEYPLSFDLVMDVTGEIGSNYGADRLPMTYIIDRKGFVVRRAVGPREWDSEPALELFAQLMREPAGGSGPATAQAVRQP